MEEDTGDGRGMSELRKRGEVWVRGRERERLMAGGGGGVADGRR